jgi:hypothetical protein
VIQNTANTLPQSPDRNLQVLQQQWLQEVTGGEALAQRNQQIWVMQSPKL